MSERKIKYIVAFKIVDGLPEACVYDPHGEVAIVLVDDNAPNDRCYEWTARNSAQEVMEFAPRPWGNSSDGTLSDQDVTRIKFALNGISAAPPITKGE